MLRTQIKKLKIIFHPIPIGIATYVSLVLVVTDGLKWDQFLSMALLNHLILILLSLTASFSIFAYMRYKPYKAKPHLLFYDNFNDDLEWKKYGDGEVAKSNDISWCGEYSLKKDKNPDPYGGYRMIGKKIKQPFTFSGWIYRSDIANGRWADRIAIEDQNNNGYGLCISHGNHRTYIEKRIGGRGAGNGPPSVYTPPLDKWYHFVMHFGSNGRFKLWLYDVNGVCISDVPEVTDRQFKEFDRIVVHGGYPYYIDDLKIISI
jgi:hypothetical protein